MYLWVLCLFKNKVHCYQPHLFALILPLEVTKEKGNPLDSGFKVHVQSRFVSEIATLNLWFEPCMHSRKLNLISTLGNIKCRINNVEWHTGVNLSCFGIFKTLFVWLSCSVHLARRVLQLERQNTSLRRELDRHKLQSGHISEEVNTHSNQVHACLGTIINGINFNFM